MTEYQQPPTGAAAPGGGGRWAWKIAVLAVPVVLVASGAVAWGLTRAPDHIGEQLDCSMTEEPVAGDSECDAWGNPNEAVMVVELDDMKFETLEREGRSELVYSGTESMSVGDIIVTETEDGPFYGNVVSMEGGQVVTEQATLDQVFDDLDLDLQVPEMGSEIEAVPGTEVEPEGLVRPHGLVAAPAQAARKPLSCDAAISPSLDANVSLSTGSLRVTSKLRLLKPPKVNVSFRPSVTASIRAEIEAAASCGVSSPLFSAKLPTLKFIIAPGVPVWITQEVGSDVEASVAVTGSANVEVSATAQTDLGFRFANGRFRTKASASLVLDRSAAVDVEASAAVRLPLRYRAALYGLLYFEPRLIPFVEMKVRPLASEWMTIDAGLDGDLGMGVTLPGGATLRTERARLVSQRLLTLTENPPVPETTVPPTTVPPTTAVPPPTAVPPTTAQPTTPTTLPTTPSTLPPTTTVPPTTAVPTTTLPPTAPPDGGAAGPAFTPDPDRYYTLQTLGSEPFGECLEGNRVAPGSTLGGASFMAPCERVTGQDWRFIPSGAGVYLLQPVLGEADGLCLEGNRVAPGSTLGGAAFLADCVGASGQLWSVRSFDDGTFQLQTLFSQPDGTCLEGNRLGPDSTLGGAAFMAPCGNFTGELWFATALPA